MIGAGCVGVVPSREKRLENLPADTTAIWLAIKEGSMSAYDIGMEANSIGFFTGKFLPGLALVLGLELPAGRGCVGAEF